MPPDANQPLLAFKQDNITFKNVQLDNIDAFKLPYILGINGSNNIFEGLQSTASNAQNGTVYVGDTGNGINTSTVITHSSFANSTTRALYVYNSNVTVVQTVFDGLSTAVFNGGAISSVHAADNRILVANCSFRNNAATAREDSQGYVLCSCLDKEHIT